MDQGHIGQGRTVTEVDLIDYDVNAIIAIVQALKSQGYEIERDFNFHYHPPTLENKDNPFLSFASNRHTVFYFKEGSVASWFALKYKK